MKLLHTADWHLGKRLYGLDRSDEARASVDELVTIAADQNVDAVLMAGDILDRRLMDAAPLRDALRALDRFAEIAPVLVAIGNHDDPGLWSALAPYLADRRIHVAHHIVEPTEAVVTVTTNAGPLHAALMPWPEPRVMAREIGVSMAESRGTYAGKVAHVLTRYAQEVTARRAAEGGAAVIVGHVMVDGARGGGGERELTMGITHCVSAQAIPSGVDYVALGHVHRPQSVPGVATPARYSGSPMPIDFSEDNHTKSACVVTIDGDHTTVEELPLTASRPLVRLRAPLDDLATAAAAHPDAYFLCEVLLDQPELDLVRQVRDQVPDVLRVDPVYTAAIQELSSSPSTDDTALSAPLGDQYAAWYARRERPLPDSVRRAFEIAVETAERDAE